MALGLLSKLQEGLLNLNVGQRVDLCQRADAHIVEVVLAGHMSKSIDNPGSLVVASVGVGVGTGS